MDQGNLFELRKALDTSFIDASIESNLALRPQIVSNDYKLGKKVLCTIIDELSDCDSFYISVAFITMSGLAPLLEVLKELEKNGIPGKILTTDYLLFSQPKALKKLNEYKNIQIRMYYTEGQSEGFHTKGYIFQKDDTYKIIVGSANLTANALSINKEWNSKVVSKENGEYIKTILKEFNELWDSPKTLDFDEFIDRYEYRYHFSQEQKKIAVSKPIINIFDYKLKPNSMQEDFIFNLKKLVDSGAKKALLVSATGTGKTYASAFAMRELKANKILFIVHREQIARQALESYKRVFDNNISMGLLSGNSKDRDSQFIFSTMQTLSKEEYLTDFNSNDFDVIIVDEVHRAGAESYRKIFNHFKPNLWLGMTASPYRSDGFDIFKLFDNNIAHEISLQDALEEDLLCPFHYFGITDMEVESKLSQNDVYEAASDEEKYTSKIISQLEKGRLDVFSKFEDKNRVDYIIEQARYYGYSGNRVKGLIFCSSKIEAQSLSRLFNLRGFDTGVLTGESSMEERFAMIDKLVSNDYTDKLDYIFSVDIFNEGVDIPEINQIIMLRPTESPTIFIQQLGRGLRKARGKEYTIIIDFIGNYNNNFMIPIALYGDRSYNKDSIRKCIREGNRLMPGLSSVHFDEISKKRIYQAIDQANFSQINLIKENYLELKFKLGKIPSMMDFEKHGLMDMQLIFDNQSLGSYYKFLEKYEKEYKLRFNPEKEKVLKLISTKFANGKRIHELLILNYLLAGEEAIFQKLSVELEENYSLTFDENTKNNLVNIFTGNFDTGSKKKAFEDCVLLEEENGKFVISQYFKSMLGDKDFVQTLKELVDYSIFRNHKYYGNNYGQTSFNLYSKYTYSDVCRLLNWGKDLVPLNIGGYKYDEATKTFPVFINYHKEEGISESINYEDRFISNSTLIAISKSGRTLESDDVQKMLRSDELGIYMHLFVRKNKDDKTSKEFYYLGRIRPTGRAESTRMQKANTNAVEIYYKLDTPVREDIYDYIVN